MPRKDREAYNEYQRQWYSSNKQVYRDKNKKLLKKKIEKLRTAKDAPCVDCGKRYPPCVMDFDHREGEVKTGNISVLAKQWSWERTLAEIAKCDIVCANCHRIRTAKRGGWFDPGSSNGRIPDSESGDVGSTPAPGAQEVYAPVA